jgi:hypothetical protein
VTSGKGTCGVTSGKGTFDVTLRSNQIESATRH